MSSYEVRVPEALILAPLQPWVKMVWISARSYQGAGDTCYASLRMIGERAVTDTGNMMDKGQVSRGLSVLETMGFIERVSARHIRCLTPEIVDHQSTFEPEIEPTNVDSQSTIVDPQSTFEPENEAPNVDPQSTTVDPQSTTVDPQSTPSENQQGKPTRKTNKSTRQVDFPNDSWQMVFGTTAFDRLQTLGKLPSSLARGREKTIGQFADTFDKLERIDKHSRDEIAAVMTWLLRDDCWWIKTNNLRSISKLRDKHRDGSTYFEIFKLQRDADATKTRPNGDNYKPATAYDRISRLANQVLASSPAGVG